MCHENGLNKTEYFQYNFQHHWNSQSATFYIYIKKLRVVKKVVKMQAKLVFSMSVYL